MAESARDPDTFHHTWHLQRLCQEKLVRSADLPLWQIRPCPVAFDSVNAGPQHASSSLTCRSFEAFSDCQPVAGGKPEATTASKVRHVAIVVNAYM